jgi:hypothetical protein
MRYSSPIRGNEVISPGNLVENKGFLCLLIFSCMLDEGNLEDKSVCMGNEGNT